MSRNTWGERQISLLQKPTACFPYHESVKPRNRTKTTLAKLFPNSLKDSLLMGILKTKIQVRQCTALPLSNFEADPYLFDISNNNY